MKYNTEYQEQADQAVAYLDKLLKQAAVVEIKKVNPKRSLQQNKYLHVTFGIFAVETGYTPAEAKIIFKRYANTDMFVYNSKGVNFLRSTADLTTAEMTKAIDTWRIFSSEQGIEIPPPTDDEALMHWQNMIEQAGF